MIIEYARELTTGGHLSVEKLNEMGLQGWDNYAIVGNVYLFKRAKERVQPATSHLFPPKPPGYENKTEVDKKNTKYNKR